MQDYSGEELFYLQLNYDGPYTNPPTNYGPARNRFYRDYLGREFKSFPRTAYNENLVEQLFDGDTGRKRPVSFEPRITPTGNG